MIAYEQEDGSVATCSKIGSVPSGAVFLEDVVAPDGPREAWRVVNGALVIDQPIADEIAFKETKMTGIEFEGVLCSASAQDMWGLASIRSYVAAGVSTKFVFDNGNVLVITPANLAAFEATWIPFRQSFFQ